MAWLAWVEIDTHGEIADTDITDNRWPQAIGRHLVGLREDSPRDNPMQKAEREEARESYRPTAEEVAKAIYQAWTEAQDAHTGDDVLVPTAVRDALSTAAADVQDPWGRQLRLAFAADPKPFNALAKGERPADAVRIATFRSAGEDGAFETHDDIVWRVMADGSTSQ